MFVARPVGALPGRESGKECRDGCEDTEAHDEDDADDDTERSGAVMATTAKNVPGGAILSIGDTASLLQAGIREVRELLLPRRKRRGKRRI